MSIIICVVLVPPVAGAPAMGVPVVVGGVVPVVPVVIEVVPVVPVVVVPAPAPDIAAPAPAPVVVPVVVTGSPVSIGLLDEHAPSAARRRAPDATHRASRVVVPVGWWFARLG
jgi:hypothetical protein